MQDPVARLNAALEGRYRIESELGEGGMAKVYLADDLKHGRKVALKVLKPELAAVVGAERFLAEIKTTASLQHPHILPLFDSGQADTFLFYVMPYVQGETLAQRIARERQLPVDEALGIATAVANALHAAHEHGIIHRDIKPGNILMSRGEPVVADFGIALAVGAAGGGRLTETGLSLGTPYYMSPEQATGDQVVGRSSDVFALACVLYEMLIGEPPYPGNTAQAVLGKIIQGLPVSATAIRKSVPVNVDSAIRKALEKLPADRFTRVEDFAKALSNPAFRYGEEATVGVVAGVGPWKNVSIALTASTVLFGVVAASLYMRPEATLPIERFAAPFAEGQAPTAFGPHAFTLSPDGSMLVYRRQGDAGEELWVRRWDDLEAVPVRGTTSGSQPTVSDDGTEIAFVVRGEIKVVSVDGGPVRTVTQGLRPHWGPDGYLYASSAGTVVGVPATGGAAETMTPDSYDKFTILYDVLPGGKGALVGTVGGGRGRVVLAMDLATGEMTLLTRGILPKYAASGHLVYLLEDGALMAAPFDPEAMELTGRAVLLLEGVVAYSLSDTGKLFYSKGDGSGLAEFVWVTRTGQATVIDDGWTFDPGGVNPGWSLSPDGTHLAYRQAISGNEDIWIKQLPDGPNQRITRHEAGDNSPRWSPDGERLLFTSDRVGGSDDLWTLRADGTGVAELVFDHTSAIIDGSWSSIEDWIVLRVFPAGNRDIVAFRPGVDSVAVPLLVGEHDEKTPALSPDGRWLAYVSTETGSEEVFVRPFPDVEERKWPISTNGGIMPVWADNGRELFFVDSDRGLVSAQVSTDSGFQVTERETLFTVPREYRVSASNILFDVSPDGQKFLMARTEDPTDGGESPVQMVLVNNFFEVLKERVGN